MRPTWFEGDLWPYESAASIGATYCWVNKVEPKRFAAWISRFATIESANENEGSCCFDRPGFNVRAFGDELREPLEVVRTLSVKQLIDAPAVSTASKVLSPCYGVTRYCPECLAMRYHSWLHQLPCLTTCMLHEDVALEEAVSPNADLPKSICADIRHLRVQLNLFRLHGAPKFGPLKPDCKVILTPHFLDFVNQLRFCDHRLAAKGECSTRMHAKQPRHRLALTLASCGASDPAPCYRPILNAGETCHSAHFVATQVEQSLVLAIPSGHLDELVESRAAEVQIKGLRPVWRMRYDELHSELMNGHVTCLTALNTLSKQLDLNTHGIGPVEGGELSGACAAARLLLRSKRFSCLRPFVLSRFTSLIGHNAAVRKATFPNRPLAASPIAFPCFAALRSAGLVKVVHLSEARFTEGQINHPLIERLSISKQGRGDYDMLVPTGLLAQVVDELLLSRLFCVDRVLRVAEGEEPEEDAFTVELQAKRSQREEGRMHRIQVIESDCPYLLECTSEGLAVHSFRPEATVRTSLPEEHRRKHLRRLRRAIVRAI